MIAVGVVLCTALVGAADVGATTLYVANHGTDAVLCGTKTTPCRSITIAILLAHDKDTISVGPGLYGDLDGDGILSGPFTGEEFIRDSCNCMILIDKRLTIESQGGAAVTVLDTGSAAREAVRITADNSVFGKKNRGFTVTGTGTGDVGITTVGSPSKVTIAGNRISISRTSTGIPAVAIEAGGSDLTVADNVMSNDGNFPGEGFVVTGGGDDSLFLRNVVTRGGVAFFLGGDRMQIRDNVAVHNEVAALVVKRAASGIKIRGNTFIENGEGMSFGDAQPGIEITKNNIFGNGRGGTNCGITNFTGAAITESKNFWGSAAGPGPEPADSVCGSDPVISLTPAASPHPVKATAGR